MNIRFARDEFAFNGPGSVNYSPAPADGAERVRVRPAARTSGLVARARAWLAQAQRRRQAINELQMLTDHELSDIGLVRSEIPMIFEPGFAEQYDSRRRHI